jgi:predicted transcriptional regulator
MHGKTSSPTREKLGIPVAFGDHFVLDKTVIVRLESGTQNPRIATVTRVATALGEEQKLVTA